MEYTGSETTTNGESSSLSSIELSAAESHRYLLGRHTFVACGYPHNTTQSSHTLIKIFISWRNNHLSIFYDISALIKHFMSSFMWKDECVIVNVTCVQQLESSSSTYWWTRVFVSPRRLTLHTVIAVTYSGWRLSGRYGHTFAYTYIKDTRFARL